MRYAPHSFDVASNRYVRTLPLFMCYSFAGSRYKRRVSMTVLKSHWTCMFRPKLPSVRGYPTGSLVPPISGAACPQSKSSTKPLFSSMGTSRLVRAFNRLRHTNTGHTSQSHISLPHRRKDLHHVVIAAAGQVDLCRCVRSPQLCYPSLHASQHHH